MFVSHESMVGDSFIEDLFTDPALGIRLKLERKSQIAMNYLDIKVSIIGGEYRTEVFRKPTYTPFLIPNWSQDPSPYKIASFRSLLRRLNTHCSTFEAKMKELKWIIREAERHGYSSGVVWKLYYRMNKNIREQTPRQTCYRRMEVTRPVPSSAN